MSYQVLARKWRPGSFHEMVGQEHVLRALINALDNDRLHHAYLFTGTRGVGKTTIARIFAKCLNCEQGVSSQPCGQCSSCQEISEGRSVDLLEVDAASRTKVEDTRELLENVQYAPTRCRYKVYLIDEVHMLSGHSFNALLKTLEEPPPHVKFLLATTDPQRLPATILSRCLQFNLKNMPPEQIVGHLKHVLEGESIPYEDGALWLLGRAAAGSMRDALSLSDQAIAFGSGKVEEDDVRSMLGTVDLSFVYQLLEAVAKADAPHMLEIVAHMAEHAPDFEGSLDELISVLHRIALAQVVPGAIDNSWGDAQRIADLAAAMKAEDAQLFYQLAVNGKRDLPMANEPRSGFEMILLRMIAFKPEAVVDPALGPEDVQLLEGAGETDARDAAGEVGSTAKKSPEQGLAPSPLEELDPGTWPPLLDRLGLVGIVWNIASNCELSSRQGHTLEFTLDADHGSLFNDSHSDKIRLALQNYFDCELSVSITPGEVRGETPAQRQERLKQERMQQAVTEIESDARLQELIVRFDGQLDRSSIAPLDT
jgi:DNA polymerase-3 subunit gamma/tau